MTAIIPTGTTPYNLKSISIAKYIEEGCKILAIKPNSKVPYTGFTADKTSRSITTDIIEAQGWLKRRANLNIAIFVPLTAIALDVDTKTGKKGDETLAWLESCLGALPPTREVTTPSGGKHKYYSVPADWHVLGGNNIWEGIDTRRGDNFYLLTPPSTIDGVPYQWASMPYADMAPLPPAWMAALEVEYGATPVRKRAQDSNSTWMQDCDARYREDHPLHINPITLYIRSRTVRDEALAIGLWEEVDGSIKLRRIGSKNQPGFYTFWTGSAEAPPEAHCELGIDSHDVLGVGSDKPLNAFQLRKWAIFKELKGTTHSTAEDEAIESAAYQQAIRLAWAVVPAQTGLYPSAPEDVTVHALNALADALQIPAAEVRDVSWFEAAAAGATTVVQAAELAGLVARYEVAGVPGFTAASRERLVQLLEEAGGRSKAMLRDIFKKALAQADHAAKAAKAEAKAKSNAEGFDAATLRVREMNLTLASVLRSGRHFVMDCGAQERWDNTAGRMVVDHTPRFTQLKELRVLYRSRPAMQGRNDAGKAVMMNELDAWVSHPECRTYPNGVVYIPANPMHDIPPTPAGTFNLFPGWAIKPAPGDWSIFAEHYRDVWCSGDPVQYEYVLNWFARLVQYPNSPALTALVLQGIKRIGKGAGIAPWLRALGTNAIVVSQPEELVGRFTGHLQGRCFVSADEAMFAGDRAAADHLKALITEPKIAVEAKYMPLEVTDNCLHVIMSTNHDHVAVVTADETRFAVLTLSPHRKGDAEYFDKLGAATQDDAVIAAMLYDLAHRDISAFRPERIPRTKALAEQVVHSFTPEQEFLAESLINGRVAGGAQLFDGGVWEPAYSASELYDNYLRWCSTHGKSTYARSTQTAFGKQIGKIFDRKRTAQGQNYLFGELDVARAVFCEAMKISVADLLSETDSHDDALPPAFDLAID